MPNKNKKARYAITNVSLKDIYKIMNEYEKFPYKGYVQKITKNKPTDSYFYLARQISKCMVRAGTFNSQVDPVRTEVTITQRISI